MQIHEVMTRNVQVVSPDDTLIEAARLMKEQDTGFLPVCDGNKILGTITDRDIVVRAIAAGLDAATTQIRHVMTAHVEWVYANDDVTTAANHMQDNQIRRLIVVDDSKKLVGVLSLGDLALDAGQAAKETLEDVSTPGHHAELTH